MTLEGWARLDTDAGTNMLIHKKPAYKEEGYFVTVRKRDSGTLLYSYLGYSESEQRAGSFPIHKWTHWAVTSDGVNRRHYINGELAGEFTEDAGVFTPSAEPLLLAKTVPVNTGLAECRLWNVARTQTEIKSTMDKNVTTPMPGLIAVWPLGENAKDVIGDHHGVMYNNLQFKKWKE